MSKVEKLESLLECTYGVWGMGYGFICTDEPHWESETGSVSLSAIRILDS